MKRLVLAALLAISASGSAFAVKLTIRKPAGPPITVTANANLVSALRGHDVKAITKLLSRPLAHGALWFPDAACTKRFGEHAMLTSDAELAAFARCLGTLQLETTTRESADTTLDVVLTYKPGIEVEVRFASTGKVASFGADWQLAAATPMLTAQAFEALRKSGTTNLDAVLAPKLENSLTSGGAASTWIRICLDTSGKVTTVSALQPSGAGVGELFEAAIADWTFHPFAVRGTAVAACTHSLLTYPAAKAPIVETLPAVAAPPSATAATTELDDFDDDDLIRNPIALPPSRAPQNVPPSLLEAQRIAGTKLIEPDPSTKTAAARNGTRLVGSFKLCVAATGAVFSVTQLKSTGYAFYDAKILSEMHSWKYRPYMINGVAAPVCTAVTFIYSP